MLGGKGYKCRLAKTPISPCEDATCMQVKEKRKGSSPIKIIGKGCFAVSLNSMPFDDFFFHRGNLYVNISIAL